MTRLLFITFIFVIGTSAIPIELSNFQSSVYLGIANGTNTGGAIGIGTEVKIKNNFSFNIALGSLHTVLEQEVSKSKFDFDLGIKYYPIQYIYFGLNYGFIDYEYIRLIDETGFVSNDDETSFTKTRGFSFTVGTRTPSFNNFYLSGYVGITSNEEVNRSDADGFLDDKIGMPRMGVMLGYILDKFQ
ncbi:MAG TPA: hypothetical protein PLK90_09680 [Clostridiales bacterium]|nr:hypothetical protein [Clostridiales bacterium]HQP70655.1 hypothetical protein [Clostridiales bacterium]